MGATVAAKKSAVNAKQRLDVFANRRIVSPLATADETETQMAKATPTLNQGMEAVARNLREFGYPDVTAVMIRDVYDAWLSGNRYPDLPHGIIGGFAERQFEENGETLAKLMDR
jgi:hypothetical protein